MISKPSSVSKQFNECYPMAISEYKNDTWDDSSLDLDQSLDDAFQHLEVKFFFRSRPFSMCYYSIEREASSSLQNFDKDLEEPGMIQYTLRRICGT